MMVCPPAVHLNPEIYQDPLAFNPSRWDGRWVLLLSIFSLSFFNSSFSMKNRITEQGLESNGGSKHFMAFGGGMRFCVGTDFTKLQMAILLHYLVSKYRYKVLHTYTLQIWM